MSEISLLAVCFAGLRLSIPLILAAMGGLFSERSGVPNIALECFLLSGAFTAAAITTLSGSPWAGMSAGLMLGALLGAAFWFLVVRLKGDAIVMGTAFNLLALGLIPILGKRIFGVSGSTPTLALDQRLSFATFMILCGVVLMMSMIYLTKFRGGLRLRFAGENAVALQSLGVSPQRQRLKALIISGVLAAAGGAYLSICHASQFTRGMSAGRGFIALAALILGGWRPLPTLLACVMLGVADAAQILLQSAPIWNGETLPVQWIQSFPYAVTLLVMILVRKNHPPRELSR